VSEQVDKKDWNAARPEKIPSPTFAPAAMAFGTALFMWGFLTSMVLIVVGLIVMVASLTGWIGEIRGQRRA
jgi:hypothetical protein